MEGCHFSCSFYNCKRTYNHPDALNTHLKDHHKIPAQSLPGKSFLCSTIGCDGSFSSMQQLMDHMRHHHKPNYFFLCESCRAKLRSYRTLLKHLQTCAKVAKSKAARVEGGPAPDSAFPGADFDPAGSSTGDDSQQMDSDPSLPPQALFHTASSDQASSTPLVESAAAFEAVRPQNQPDAPYSPFPPSLSPAPDPEPQRSPRPGPVGIVTSLPQTTPGSNAVWRKNQADLPAPILHRWNSPQALSREEVQSFNSRILWEHTRGRYSCLQCGYSTPERKEMTAHIEGQHRSPGAKTNDADAAVGSPSSLVKTSTNSENMNYTQL
ncbi:zinc finger protein 414 isoform X1 [Ictalurus punctatus]|uniref:Zinc finger protein 414 isoform X1 n=1 Tax=Ictalurus punctatus TaxID=7998 RepID=A0A2D0SVV6_ICTPU|nr:zinc finger protein 414 isoform X1 [Ictalurus punctatus]XP_017346822.1 zinc finger protein 414 isoform X1 [Ictalurus punctatus]